jgi:hypothetical protein
MRAAAGALARERDERAMADERTGQDIDGHGDGHGVVDAVLGRGGLAPEAVRRIGLALLGALGAAHARGFVHRDLSPENVFLAGPAGAVRLCALGAARSPVSGSANGADGADGRALGAVAYLAPERLPDPSRVDARTDLWAVGVMLYELLAGTLPYRATSLGEMMSALALSEPVPIQVHLPDADASVRRFFARALARARAQRFASVHEMARALAAVAIETAAPPPQTMGGMPTTASGETDPRSAAGRRGAAVPVQAAPSPIPAAPVHAAPSPIPVAPVHAAPSPIPVASVWTAAQLVRPPSSVGPLVRLSASRPVPAPERRWPGLSIAAAAVIAIIVGIIAIATSIGASSPSPLPLPTSEAADASSRR